MRFWCHLSQIKAHIFSHCSLVLGHAILSLRSASLSGVGYKVHSHDQCSKTPASRWKIWNLLKYPHPSHLRHFPVKQQLIGLRDQGADWSEGRDAAAKSFICLAEIVYQWSSKRREHLLWRGREGFSQEAFNRLGLFGGVPFFYWLNSRGDQHTEAKWNSSSALEGRSPVLCSTFSSFSTFISVA